MKNYNKTAKANRFIISLTNDGLYTVFKRGNEIPIAKFKTREDAVTYCNNYNPNQIFTL